MNKSTILALVASSLLLGGCQNMGNIGKTMFDHIRINSAKTAYIAKGNAYTNFCLSKNMLDKQLGYEFSTVAAEFLDLVVFDNEFYKNTYENAVAAVDADYKKDSNAAAVACKSLEGDLPKVIAEFRTVYSKYAEDLGVSRSAEYQKIAQSMSNFSLPATPMPQTPAPRDFPNFGYAQQQPQTQNFLINSKSGLTQCRVTKNNFVFCL